MALPPLTPEQRAQALKKAAEARQARAEVKARLKDGSTSLKEVLERGATDEIIGKIKVGNLLESLPGVGKVKAKAIMTDIGISESRRIKGLGPHQKEQLIKRFS
ncbi:MAG: helix-hairpin-helix domain-containing protein [Bifidobacteriaceae bacterium]|jgi:transposase|nr:helix-hairpin-helix domain-containing protein [Bifidobacteriaceae bacterium]